MIQISNTRQFISSALHGFRPLSRSRRLGQPTSNRLLEIPVSAILNRGLVGLPPEALIYDRGVVQPVGQIAKSMVGGEANYQKLKEISQNPTKEEIEDLSVVEAYYQSRDFYGKLLCSGKLETSGEFHIKTSEEAIDAARSNPFYCPPEISIPDNSRTLGDYRYYFLIPDTGMWGEVRSWVLNAITFLQVLEKYPFPLPVSLMPGGWAFYVTPGVDVPSSVRGLIKGDYLLDPDFIKFWITLSVLATYEPVSAGIVESLENKARREKRKKILQSLALSATLAVITAGISTAITPLLPVAGTFTGANVAKVSVGIVQQAYSYQQRKETAQKLERAAAQFEKTDSAFAEEVRKAARVLDALSSGLTDLSQEEKDAIDEAVGGIDLPLIAGIAVVGAGALLLVLS